MKSAITRLLISFFILFMGVWLPSSQATELVQLSPRTWDKYAPEGKEVDCIYGDLVLRNEQIVTVIGNPVPGRNANMTVKGVGGAIIDLTLRGRPNDQLGAYYPCGSRYNFTDASSLKVTVDDKPAAFAESIRLSGKSITLELTAAKDATAKKPRPSVLLRYTLSDGDPLVRVETVHHNDTSEPTEEMLTDAIRADKVFRFGTDDALFKSPADGPANLFWASDEWFGQSYGVVCDGRQIRFAKDSTSQLDLAKDGQTTQTIPPGEQLTISRRIFPGSDIFEVRAIGQHLAAVSGRTFGLRVTDPGGPVAHALVAIDEAPSSNAKAKETPNKDPDKETKFADEKDKSAKAQAAAKSEPPPIEKTYPKASYGLARTDADGRIRAYLPFGRWRVVVRAMGRPEAAITITSGPGEPRHADQPFRDRVTTVNANINLASPGYVAAHITDERGEPIPAKVSFFGKDGARDPFFGPDTGEVAVHNAYYTHTGKFRQAIAPGRYSVIVSNGPEYDAIFTDIEVKRGEDAQLTAKLIRSVNSAGWVSTDYHSHSSPSGDNVSSQTGRVLNLLCEHIEFAPCTEHNRIDSYAPILKRLGIERLMATCSGMELTGSPLPVNHQNAFPLVLKPRTQDAGAPTPHANPVVQIERLALWDDKSDKLVQGNHPNLPQILGDRDLNAQPDEGFRKMFGFMDVVEIHPPELIFTRPEVDSTGKLPRNPIYHWMQMLNMGYRIAGVVNTDAHYNFHGSGGLRNYVKSSTDDPAKIDTMEMVRQSEAGHMTVTNGPFLEVSAQAGNEKVAIPGDDLAAPDRKIALSIRVQCTNWFDINRVQVFLNGRPAKHLNFTRREHAERFSKESVRFDATLPIELAEDTHVIVAAAGEGLQLGPVLGPTWGKKMPIAVSNPIFVDVDGGGFRPNGDRLDVELPLPEGFRQGSDGQGTDKVGSDPNGSANRQ